MRESQVEELVQIFIEWAGSQKTAGRSPTQGDFESETRRAISNIIGTPDIPQLIVDFYAGELRAVACDEGA